MTHVGPPVVEHRDHTFAFSSEYYRPHSTQKWCNMSDILDYLASIPLFEEDPQALLAMEPSMPMHAYMMHGSDPKNYAEASGHPEWEAEMDFKWRQGGCGTPQRKTATTSCQRFCPKFLLLSPYFY